MEEVGPAARTLAEIVEEAIDRDLDALGGETTLVGRSTPPAPATQVPDVLSGAETIVGVVPRIDPALLEALTDDADDLTAAVVVTGRARTRLTGPSRLAARSALEERDVSLYAHDGDAPVGVLLVDDRAVVGLFEGSELAAVLVSTAPAVVEWAGATCTRYREASEPVFE